MGIRQMGIFQDSLIAYYLKFQERVIKPDIGYFFRDVYEPGPTLIMDIDPEQIYAYHGDKKHLKLLGCLDILGVLPEYRGKNLLKLLSYLKADKKEVAEILDSFTPKINYRFDGVGWE
jgi:hypothetical protein